MNPKAYHRGTRHGRRELQRSHPSHAGAGGLLICIACSKVHPFEDEALEAFEEQVAWRHGFVLLTCKLELYGLCPFCLDSKEKGCKS